jgi:hypothetical protein
MVGHLIPLPRYEITGRDHPIMATWAFYVLSAMIHGARAPPAMLALHFNFISSAICLWIRQGRFIPNFIRI